MTEKEKMLAGILYDANYDEALLQERTACKELCYDYNLLRPSQTEQQDTQMRKILGKTGASFCILAPFWCDYGYNIEIGENFFANHTHIILDWNITNKKITNEFLICKIWKTFSCFL